jgi:hypothetical protein
MVFLVIAGHSFQGDPAPLRAATHHHPATANGTFTVISNTEIEGGREKIERERNRREKGMERNGKRANV